MKRYLFLAFIFTLLNVFANADEGCSISDLLAKSKSSALEVKRDRDCMNENISSRTTAISKKLKLVEVKHENKKVLIERRLLDSKKTCPPFCISPMNIKSVLTVGELEVLAFIDKLKEKRARLLIDVRESRLYDKGTIPGSINIPFSMIKPKSSYQEEVLLLLGAKKEDGKSSLDWSFDEVQSLLIFGDSIISNEAADTIKELLRLGYPGSKLLYYRGGVKSWKALGLTVVDRG